MYAITGASGRLGRLVLNELIARVPADQIIATTRAPEKLRDLAALGVNVRKADFADPSTLGDAYKGAGRLLIISTYVPGRTVELHTAAIRAASNAGVDRIVYTSTPNAEPSSRNPLLSDHGQTEAALAESGVAWTALRNGYYSELLRDFLGLLLVENELLIPSGASRHGWISREDCARAAVGVLLGALHAAGPLDVTGPEALSFADIASRLYELSDHRVKSRQLTESEIVERLTRKGISEGAAKSTVQLVSRLSNEPAVALTDVAERAGGLRPASIDQLIRDLATG